MLWRSLRDAGHEVLLVSFSRQYPNWLFPGSSDRDPSVDGLAVPDAQFWIDSLNPLTWFATFARILRYKPDRLILQWWSAYWAPVWLVMGGLSRATLKCPVIQICHNVVPHEWHWYSELAAWIGLRWGDLYIVHSASEAQELRRFVGSAEIRVRNIPKYDVFLAHRLPKTVARQRLQLGGDVPVLLFFGLIREYKGLEDLLEAMPAVRVSYPEVKLLVAGEFWDDRDLYTARVGSLGLKDAIAFDDRYIPNEEVAVYFSAADVLVAPYRSVTGSAVIQTGRSFGLPIVTTRVGGLEEFADSYPATHLAERCDPQSLASRIVDCLDERPRTRPDGEALLSMPPQTLSDEWLELVNELAM
jgi:glycosyltransferase involved in cell wall biosynthesis